MSSFSTAHFPRTRRQHGVTLVIVLVFILLLTGVTVAFFSRALNVRQSSDASASQVKGDLLARSALNIIVGDLKQEIKAGSTPRTSGSVTIFQPQSNITAVPFLVGVPVQSGSSVIPNLLKRSAYNLPFYSGTAYSGTSSNSACNVSGTAVSINGRSVSYARWNSHYLIPRLNAGSAVVDTTPIATFVPPDWVLLARNGTNPIAWNDNLRWSGVRPTTVVGRFAYAIYNEGGLLDVNTAGFPAALSSTFAARKGALALADLTAIGLSNADVDNLVGWRNYATGQPGGTFPNFTFTAANSLKWFNSFVLSNTTGFLSVSNSVYNGRSDQAFVTRQELLRLRNALGFSQDALQYMGTFSRELNAPSSAPLTPSGSSIDYAALANSSGVNRFFPNVRVTDSFTRADGTRAKVDEPLIKSRFPLSRIGGLGPSGIVSTGNTTMDFGMLSTATASTVQRDFGLVWNSSANRWDYCGPTGSTVQTSIAKISSIGNREPNFFELLKAGILAGSLGQASASQGTFFGRSDPNKNNTYDNKDRLTDLQIIRIGANLIDQYDADDIPTVIAFNPAGYAGASPYSGPQLALGTENLPYVNKLMFSAYRPGAGSSIELRAQFELWNPHQNPTATPYNLRLVCTNPSTGPLIGTGTGTTISNALNLTPLTNPAAIQFVNAAAYGTSKLAGPALPSGGIVIATGTAPDTRLGPGTQTYNQILFDSSSNGQGTGSYELQIQSGTRWITYQILQNSGAYATSTYVSENPAYPSFTDPNGILFVTRRVDPRGERFGSSTELPGGSTNPMLNNCGWTSSGVAENRPVGSIFSPNSGSALISPGIPLYLYAENKNTSAAHYSDLDGITRRGDEDITGGLDPFPHDGSAATTINKEARPIVLNRPFSSVAETGYAYRDLPWKTLDFFSATSPDSALLDLFAATECPVTSGMRSGVLDLNTRQPLVLKALLNGALLKQGDGTTISPANSASIAINIPRLTGTAPFLTRSDLIGFVASDSTFPPASTPKTQRETIVRGLVDSGQTRTWNLMIDLIAQTGRYTMASSSLSQFSVEAERRYWLHIAIDRYTGQILDQQLELVTE